MLEGRVGRGGRQRRARSGTEVAFLDLATKALGQREVGVRREPRRRILEGFVERERDVAHGAGADASAVTGLRCDAETGTWTDARGRLMARMRTRRAEIARRAGTA